jgi:hypothetical protein
MSTLLTIGPPEASDLVSGVLVAQFAIPQTSSDLWFQIEIPDFQSTFVLPLVDISPTWEDGKVTLKAAVDQHSRLAFTLLGEFGGYDEPFKIKQLNLSLDKDGRLARSEFMLCSLWAIFALAQQIHLRMEDWQLDLRFGFNAQLLEIGDMLRRRQIAYRVMVIEVATGVQFQVPVEISGDEVEEIALIYHAIIDRSFDWPIDKITVFFPATEEWRDRLLLANDLPSFTLGPDPVLKTLFGKQIYLGEGTITLLDQHIENFDNALQELSTNDGHEVAVVIRSLSGHGHHQMPKAPRLPDSPWPDKIKQLINLEDRLDTKLVQRYNELAAETVAGLSDEEKTEITARSEIGEAFYIDPSPVEEA